MSTTSNTGGVDVFVSYRRDEAEDAAGRITLGLKMQRADFDVFFDRDSIGAGRDFEMEIVARIAKADAMLAVIGERWASEEGLQKLAKDEDWIRRELESALERGVPIIPVLIHGAQTPREGDMPESLQSAFRLNAVVIHGDAWDHSIGNLVECLAQLKRDQGAQSAAPTDQATHEPEQPEEPERPQESAQSAFRPPDYVLATRAALNGGSIDMTARELLQIFGRQHLTETARIEIDETLRAGGLRCQPKASRLAIYDRVRVTREKEVPEFHLRAKVDSEGPVTILMAELLDLFGHRRLSDKTREELENCLRYVGLAADPRLTRVDKDGIVVVSPA